MERFEEIIDTAILPLMSKRCAILDAPYYNNVGDVLIWEGIEQFLEKHNIECLYRSSCETFEYRHYDDDVCICLVGGGNFGDLWRGLQEFRNRIISTYSNNRIIVFPQSVYYNSNELLMNDIEVLSKHKDVYLCARDTSSYEFFKKHFFANHIMLLPDMSLYVDYSQYPVKVGKGTLFLKREDKEAIQYSLPMQPKVMDVTDWPMHKVTIEERQKCVAGMRWPHRILRHVCSHVHYSNVRLGMAQIVLGGLITKLTKLNETPRVKWMNCYCEYEYLSYINRKFDGRFNMIIDYWMYNYHRPLIIQYGVDFISRYEKIYSTRLHAGIMSAMLGKQTMLIDNSYGKLSALYESWLSEMKDIQMIKCQ